MNKLKLTIDAESINMENEIHENNFSKKIKNLAQHCVNFINSTEDEKDCINKNFLPEIHDNNGTYFENNDISFLIKNKIEANYKYILLDFQL